VYTANLHNAKFLVAAYRVHHYTAFNVRRAVNKAAKGKIPDLQLGDAERVTNPFGADTNSIVVIGVDSPSPSAVAQLLNLAIKRTPMDRESTTKDNPILLHLFWPNPRYLLVTHDDPGKVTLDGLDDAITEEHGVMFVGFFVHPT